METTLSEPATVKSGEHRRRRSPSRRSPLTRGQNLFGWIFVSPALAILCIFLVIPIILALYISFTDWSGVTSPFSHLVHWVGLQNYKTILTQPGLAESNFGTAVRNNFYYVVTVVPIQTGLSLWLAILVNDKFLKGKGLFRTAFYFPSVTSSIAITTVFIYLFSTSGVINRVLNVFGIAGPNWLYDQNGVITSILGALGVHTRAVVGQLPDPGGICLELAFRTLVRNVRDHHPRHLDDVGDVHAPVPRRPAERFRRG